MPEYCTMKNVVKQGGDISPILSSIYIFIYYYYNCGIQVMVAIYMYTLILRALSYADDLTLIAHSIEGLIDMFKLCDDYATVYNVMFNSKKLFILNLVMK